MDARQTGDLGFDSLLRHFFINSNQHFALPGPPGGQTVGPPFPVLVDKLFIHHLSTTTKRGAMREGGPSNKVKTFGGQTVGGGCNQESLSTVRKRLKNIDW